MLNWGFQQKIVGSRSISEAKNLVIFCRCLVEFAGIASCFFFVVGYLLLCFFIKPGSMIEKLGELLGPKYSSMEHGVKCRDSIWLLPKLKSAAHIVSGELL